MGKYFVDFEDIAQKDLKNHCKSGNQATIKNIEKILLELTVNPFAGEGQPEELKRYWSGKINQKDRLIYKVEEEIVTVIVVSAMGHYSDK